MTDDNSIGQPPHGALLSVNVGDSSDEQEVTRETPATVTSSNLHNQETSTPRPTSEQAHPVENTESSNDTDADERCDTGTADEIQGLEQEDVFSTIPCSLRESDAPCEMLDHNDDDLVMTPNDEAEIAVGIPTDPENHSLTAAEQNASSLLQVAGKPNLPVVSSASSQHPLNPPNGILSQPNRNSISFEERMQRKGLGRNFAPAVRISRQPSNPDYQIDRDEEKEEVRERISLTKRVDQIDETPSSFLNGTAATASLPKNPPDYHLLDRTRRHEISNSQRRPPTHSSNTSRYGDEDPRDDDPLPELPSITDGDNHHRPGAFTAHGRAFGEYPAWGRSRPAATILQRNSSSSETTTSSSLRRSSDSNALRNSGILFSSIRAAAYWLPTNGNFPQTESQRNEMQMVEAQAVDAEAVVYASDVRVDVSKRIIRTYTCAICVAGFIIVVLAVSLSLALTDAGRRRRHGSNPTNTKGNAAVQTECQLPDTLLDVFALCRCFNSTDKLVMSTEETTLYNELHLNFSQNGLLYQELNKSSCLPENQSLLWISNYKKLGLDLSSSRNPAQSYEQYFALACLYVTSNGTGWRQHIGWMTNMSVCNWYGVSCGIITRIMSVRLNSNGLVGTIPPSIRLLPFLQFLDLSGNPEMHGTIPSGMGQMTSLYMLDLSACNFSGTLPRQLHQLNRIGELHFESNNLSGRLPVELGALSLLRTLSVRGNHFFGKIPTTFAKLQNLGYLDLSHNNFSGTVPGFIGGLPYLDSVFLQENKFTGAFPDSFCNQSTERFDGGQAKVVIANCDGPYLKHTNCSCCSNVLYCVNGTAQGFQGVF